MLVALALTKNLFVQFCALFGCWVAAAAALSYLSRAMNKALADCAFPRLGLYLFGWIGVPVHELSHALFAKLFAHEINAVKWFDPEAKDGAHGAVTHSYSRWNLYHRLGHFFIGLAPAIIGPALIGVLLYTLVPPARVLFHTDLRWPNAVRVAELARALFNRTTLRSFRFYAFVYLAICIASQIELSREDIKQAARGLVPLTLVLIFGNIVGAIALKPMALAASRRLSTRRDVVYEPHAALAELLVGLARFRGRDFALHARAERDVFGRDPDVRPGKSEQLDPADDPR